MKLKIRADEKDIQIFLVFAIMLLYIVAVASLNLQEFSSTGVFHGFNPFPAFAPDQLGTTFVLYIFALLMIALSVKSYFFDREKGIGLIKGKEEESGYSRWAKESEIKKELVKIDPASDVVTGAGIPLINNKKGMWVDNGEYHSLIIGATGSGKTQLMVHPLVKSLAKHGESMIITDPKGEIYEKHGKELEEKGYNVILLNFRDPLRGSSWNPMSLPYQLYKEGNVDKAIELIDDLALNILYDESAKGQDPFWEKTSADYFAGLSLALFDDAKEEEINLNSINIMTTVGEQKIGASTYVKEFFSDKDPAGAAYTNASSTLIAPADTKGSILSVFKQKIKLFASRENISEMLSHSDFDMKEIGRKKTAVFLVIQDEKKTYHPLVTIFLKQCYETLIDVAQESGGQLPFRTNFILDEFANMPPLKDVTTMITASRSRKIRFNFIIQNFAQLTQVYGKEDGETIKGNCGNIIYLISSELNALEEISKMSGEKKSKKDDKTASTPLVTVSDLQRLKPGDTIILRTRCMPFKTKLQFQYQMENSGLWGKTYGKATFPTREKKSVQVFDLKAFVDEKVKIKREKMISGGGARTNSMPGSNMPPSSSPFRQTSPRNNPGGNIPDVDTMMKRIEAQLAAIEKEEQAEKTKLSQIEKTEELRRTEEKQRFLDEMFNQKPKSKSSSAVVEPITTPPITPVVVDENKVISSGLASTPINPKEGLEVPVKKEIKLNEDKLLSRINQKLEEQQKVKPEVKLPVQEKPAIKPTSIPEPTVSPSIIKDLLTPMDKNIDNKSSHEDNDEINRQELLRRVEKKISSLTKEVPSLDIKKVIPKKEEIDNRNDKVEHKKDKEKSPESFVTDDQFFDDFFSEED